MCSQVSKQFREIIHSTFSKFIVKWEIHSEIRECIHVREVGLCRICAGGDDLYSLCIKIVLSGNVYSEMDINYLGSNVSSREFCNPGKNYRHISW